ncbi:MAG: hypothetical protein WDN69_02935 [Aliidongia sp.]
MMLRLFLLVAGTAGLGTLLSQTQFYAVSTVAAGILLLLLIDFLRYTSSADRELARIIDALAQGDLTDRPLAIGRHGADQPLAQAFARALDKLRSRSVGAEAERTRLMAVVEHAPVPLLATRSERPCRAAQPRGAAVVRRRVGDASKRAGRAFARTRPGAGLAAGTTPRAPRLAARAATLPGLGRGQSRGRAQHDHPVAAEHRRRAGGERAARLGRAGARAGP